MERGDELMGYAEGNTHGFSREDAAMEETTLFRLIDIGKFTNPEELIDHLRNNGYRAFVTCYTPFVELEVPEEEFYEVKTILNDYDVDYIIF